MVRLLSGQSQSMGKKGAKSIFRLVPLLGPYLKALALNISFRNTTYSDVIDFASPYNISRFDGIQNGGG